MEPAQLQLVFNVVAITGVSSLASFCYLLKKENRKLAAELKITNTERDVRSLAANRRTRWVKGLTSAMSYNGSAS
ncbi:MAG: hypothetical protein JWO19_4776 [Bryobacterales bacterium]|jgi:hypothetical protein|nr:hypothetical protein [Bryobacterales bacterium]